MARLKAAGWPVASVEALKSFLALPKRSNMTYRVQSIPMSGFWTASENSTLQYCLKGQAAHIGVVGVYRSTLTEWIPYDDTIPSILCVAVPEQIVLTTLAKIYSKLIRPRQ